MYTDPIADLLTRIRNAVRAEHRFVDVPASKIKLGIVRVLFDQGYIAAFRMEEGYGPQGKIKIALKYDPITKEPALREIKRISKPGLRQFKSVKDIPRVYNGLGVAIVSTSKGILTDKQARAANVGGEVLCVAY